MVQSTLDKNTLLSSLLSGGVIGGIVSIADANIPNRQAAIVLGLSLGILLDYQLKKARSEEHVEISKATLEKLWAGVTEKEVLEPETTSYWSTVVASLGMLAGISLGTYGLKATIGKYTTAAIGLAEWEVPLAHQAEDAPQFIDLTGFVGGAEPLRAQVPILDLTGSGELPRPQMLRPDGNLISAILAPTTLQVMGAFSGQRLVRRAGATLALQIVTEVVKRSGFAEKLVDLAGAGVEEIQNGVAQLTDLFTTTLVDGLSQRQENMYLSNERLLMLENPEGTSAYALLQSSDGGRQRSYLLFVYQGKSGLLCTTI